MPTTSQVQSIDAETLLTIIYYLVDNWYQAQIPPRLKGKRGAKARFSDSEVITLLLAMDFFPYPGETQFLGYIRANYRALFPKLLDQSQFNRRARALRLVVEELRKQWVDDLGGLLERQFLLDTKPIPVVGYKRSKAHSDFAGSANYGVCVSRKLHYWGYKLVLLSTLNGLPVAYELVPANTDERDASDEVLVVLWQGDVFTDKGMIDRDWQGEWKQRRDVRIWNPKRQNQKEQNSPAFDRWLSGIRERIEGAFNEVQNTGRNLERLLRKTVEGLCTHVTAKLASHALKLVLRRFFNIDVQTFTCATQA